MASLKTARIQVLISEPTPEGQFNDALYFSVDEFENLSDEEVEVLKQERVNAWLALQDEARKPRPDPTEAELVERKENLLESIAELEREVAKIDIL